ncbi:MAG TPA: 6-bladed beta-propeller [Deltaproteobacteria bacterium]|nr:6-bladed beta-propeller [Deltaproteobacteria bacterium]
MASGIYRSAPAGVSERAPAASVRAVLGRSLFAAAAVAVSLVAPQAVSSQDEGTEMLAVISGNEMIGRLKNPSALFFDEVKKRIYVADTGNRRLVSFDNEYKYLAELYLEEFDLPSGIVKDSAGLFYVVDSGKAAILRIDVRNNVVEPIEPSGVPEAGEPFIPGRIAIDGSDTLYVVDKLNKRILALDGDGVFVAQYTVPGDERLTGFADVRVAENGEVYAIDTLSGTIYIFDGSGEVVKSFSRRGTGRGMLRFPTSIAVDRNGHIYVADRHGGMVLVYDRSGIFLRAISRPGFREGELSYPFYIYLDGEGRLYTIDVTRIQVFKGEKG